MMKEVLVLTIVWALFATGQTKKNHDKKGDFEISFTNNLDGHGSVKHKISANKHEITVGQKVITLPWPLKDGWENRVKFGKAKKGKKGKGRSGRGKKGKGVKGSEDEEEYEYEEEYEENDNYELEPAEEEDEEESSYEDQDEEESSLSEEEEEDDEEEDDEEEGKGKKCKGKKGKGKKCKGKKGKGKKCKGKKGKGKKGKGWKGRKGKEGISVGYNSFHLPSYEPYFKHQYPPAGHQFFQARQNFLKRHPHVPPKPFSAPFGHQYPPVPAGPQVAGPLSRTLASHSRTKHSGRIVGGQEVQPPHSLPWQVALARNDILDNVISFCGAAIICPRYIMTAAHCTDSGWGKEVCMNQKKCIVVAGAHNVRNRDEPSRTEHHIKNYIIHPQRTEWAWDYMILELSDPIKFRREAKPVMLPRPTDASLMTPGKMILVSGWGDLENGAGQGSAKLMYASVPVVAEDKCFKIFGHQLISMESVICGGFAEGGIDSCQGDSGGPVVVLNEGYVKLMAVVSAGGDCALPGQPGVYAKMTAALDWVNEVTGNCNFRTCNEGNCVAKEDLGSASRYFSR